ncbi:MAG TPA: Stp1/IreP family PP2C-type Ser/Thr phosphatase [Candidatus Binataceae bacterium]|nr:Stp1/IreP family PP2C-type Ser/Thr phosphatase [Candidatus Binataceae bacterium]
MITCPDCGFEALDGAKFCDRCGRGLDAAAAAPRPLATRPDPLAPGAVVRGYEIVELLGQDSIENRYRAVLKAEGKEEKVTLRERLAPMREESHEEPVVEAKPETPAPPAAVDPHAKTAELKPPPGLSTNGDAVANAPASAAPPADAPPEVTTSGSTVDAGVEVAADSPAQAPDASLASDEPTEPVAPVEHANGATSEAATTAPPEREFINELPDHFGDDLGDVFGRVLALSMTLTHPAFEKATAGFANDGRVYLVYPESTSTPLSRRRGGLKMSEPDAIAIAVQVCQAVGFVHRRGLRLNDICPDSVALAADGRAKMIGLNYVSNDNELESDPIFNDGYTAPEIYRQKKVDKRADVFSVGALLYSMLTGERLQSETWREEAGPIRFYPPHVVTPSLEQVILRAVQFNPGERWANIDAMKTELLKLAGEFKIRAAALTDVGMMREHNEDSVMTFEFFRDSEVEPAQNFLYVVCDGMGGAEEGEIASGIAVAVVRDYVEDRLRHGETAVLGDMLSGALEEANRRILEYQKEHPEARGMGSTGVCAAIVPPDGAVAWVGDSRAYLLEGGALRRLTKDHSLVERLVEIGQITPEEARHHEHKNVITRSLGARQSGPAGAEAVALKLRRGDRLLLCSDGLMAHVADPEICQIMMRHDDPYPIARELIAAANAGGGSDNISVIVVFAG